MSRGYAILLPGFLAPIFGRRRGFFAPGSHIVSLVVFFQTAGESIKPSELIQILFGSTGRTHITYSNIIKYIPKKPVFGP